MESYSTILYINTKLQNSQNFTLIGMMLFKQGKGYVF